MEVKTARQLTEMDFDSPKWLIPGLLPPGLTLLSAAPKTGKSFLCLQMALCLSTRTKFPGTDSPPSKLRCGYLLLEDRPVIAKDRIEMLAEALHLEEIPEDLVLVYDFGEAFSGGDEKAIKILLNLIEDHHLDFVVIDTLVAFLTSFPQLQDYSSWHRKISRIAKALVQKGTHCILVHHTRKAFNDQPFDPLQAAHGSIGLTAAVENVALLKKNKKTKADNPTRVLHIEGKQVVENAITLAFEDGIFRVVDLAPEIVQLPPMTKKVLFCLAEKKIAMSPSEVASALGKSPLKARGTIAKCLKDLAERGFVLGDAGKYGIAKSYKGKLPTSEIKLYF